MLIKATAAAALATVATSTAVTPMIPDLTAMGASAGAFALLIWLLVQERTERNQQRAEFLAEIREFRHAVVSLKESIDEMRERS